MMMNQDTYLVETVLCNDCNKGEGEEEERTLLMEPTIDHIRSDHIGTIIMD